MSNDTKNVPSEVEFLELLARVPADEREEVIAKLMAASVPSTATKIDAEQPVV